MFLIYFKKNLLIFPKKTLAIYTIAVMLLCFSFVILFSGCSANAFTDAAAEETSTIDTSQAPGAVTINIGSLNGPTSIGMIKLHNEKPSLGKDVTSNYEIIATPDIMISKLLSEEIDIAALPTNVAVKLYNKGLNYKLAAVIGYGVLYLIKQ